MATIDVTDPAREVLQPGAAAAAGQPVRGRPRAAGGARARGRRLGRRPRPRGRRRRRQRRGARARAPRRAQRADPAHARPVRQPDRRGRARSRRGTGCCAARSSARSTACRGASSSPARHVVRAALFTLWGNANDGVMCPVSMTYAAIPALRDGAPELAAEWEPRLTEARLRQRRARRDGDDRAPGRLGRARQHHPRRAASATATYELHGHKWFCSYPPCDVFLVLAQAPGRALVLPRRARAGDGVPAAEGQARDALAAVVRGRVPRRARPADRRGGARRAGDHPDGQPHPARLPARRDHGAAPRHARGDPPRPPPLARSARCSSTSRRCATCSPTWRSSPRRRPSPRCGSRARYDERRRGRASAGSRPR